jgi:hypothetical protein
MGLNNIVSGHPDSSVIPIVRSSRLRRHRNSFLGIISWGHSPDGESVEPCLAHGRTRIRSYQETLVVFPSHRTFTIHILLLRDDGCGDRISGQFHYSAIGL